MSGDIENIIKAFSKFLDPSEAKVKKLQSIEDLLELPLHSFKFISKDQSKSLKEILDVSDVRGISEIDKEHPFRNLSKVEAIKDPIKATELHEKLDKKIEELKEDIPISKILSKRSLLLVPS